MKDIEEAITRTLEFVGWNRFEKNFPRDVIILINDRKKITKEVSLYEWQTVLSSLSFVRTITQFTFNDFSWIKHGDGSKNECIDESFKVKLIDLINGWTSI